MAMLEVKNLEVYYGVIQAIKGISFEVNEGEVIALIGANGAGKTTTLQTITGMLQPKAGEIIFEGKDISKIPGHKIVSMGMAHVPEGRRVFAELSVYENLKPYDRNVATKIIEDFMLLANETVAEHYFWQEIPFVYRTHEQPDEEKIQKLAIFINNFGHSMHIANNAVRPKEIQKLLVKVEGTNEEALISRLALRSMKQAKYTPENTGHFGLATTYYCHFTSPIRRYPDLQIHRIIKEDLRGRMNENRREHYEKILPEVTKQCSEREHLAEEAERETIKLKKVEYMEEHIGEVFEGVHIVTIRRLIRNIAVQRKR